MVDSPTQDVDVEVTMTDPMQEVFEADPLLAFAPLTRVQVKALQEVAQTISATLSASFLGGSSVDGSAMNKAYGLLWLWVLGVYEVLRTMSQAKDCFTPELRERLAIEKRYYAKLRVPLTKHEFAGGRGPAGLAGMLSGIDISRKDVSFCIEGETYSARDMINRFSVFISRIKLADIRARSPCA